MHHYHHHKHHHKKFNFNNFLHQVFTPQVGHIIDDGIKTTGSITRTGIQEIGSTTRQLIKSSGGLLSNVSWPLIIGGCVVAYIIISKK